MISYHYFILSKHMQQSWKQMYTFKMKKILTCLSPTGIFKECFCRELCGTPTSMDSKTSDDELTEDLTSKRRQLFLPEKWELNFNFPKLTRRGKRRGLESRNLEGWDWRWNVAGPWKMLLVHASIFSVRVYDFGGERVVVVVVEMKLKREEMGSTVIRFCNLAQTRAEFWAKTMRV